MVNSHEPETALHVGIYSVQSKTWLDYRAGGGPHKVYWSNGDKINVNGISSLGLSIQGTENTAVADFQIYGVEAPFKVIYPASIVTGNMYDSQGYIQVELPSVQNYDPSSFDGESAIMCGYSQESAVTLRNLCSAVRVNVTGTEQIISARVSSSSAPLCGEFKLNPEEGVLAPVDGSTQLTLEFSENIQLTEDGVDFFFTLPAGDYSKGLSFYFKRADGRNLECIWRPESALEPGKLYSFNEVKYVPGAKDITTAGDWEEFAAAVNSGDTDALEPYIFKGGFIRLGADIEAEDLTCITKDFDYIFDGGGYTLTRTSATTPLFSEVSGEIKNLSLAGNLDLGDGSGAPLVNVLKPGAKIVSCTNNMAVTASTASDTFVSGLVTTMEGGLIESCTNNGTVDVAIVVDKGIYYVAVAGIVAQFQPVQDEQQQDIILKDCTNSPTATLTLSPALEFKSLANTSDKGMKLCGLGGIAGWIRNPANYTFNNCDNQGKITISAKQIKNERGNSPRPISVGGIIGHAAPVDADGLLIDPADYSDDKCAISLTDCDNSGLIYNCSVNYSSTNENNNKVFTAGIAGSLTGREGQYANLTSCTSTGEIRTYDIVEGTEGYETDHISNRTGYCVVAGGLVGFGGYLNMDSCIVDCQIGNGKRSMVAWGGFIGFTLRPFILKDSQIAISGYYQRLTGYKFNRAVVAVVPVNYSTSTKMKLTPDVGGSRIIGSLAVSGFLMSTDSPLSAETKVDLKSTLQTPIFTTKDKVVSNLVCGQGFTTNEGIDFTSADITY